MKLILGLLFFAPAVLAADCLVVNAAKVDYIQVQHQTLYIPVGNDDRTVRIEPCPKFGTLPVVAINPQKKKPPTKRGPVPNATTVAPPVYPPQKP